MKIIVPGPKTVQWHINRTWFIDAVGIGVCERPGGWRRYGWLMRSRVSDDLDLLVCPVNEIEYVQGGGCSLLAAAGHSQRIRELTPAELIGMDAEIVPVETVKGMSAEAKKNSRAARKKKSRLPSLKELQEFIARPPMTTGVSSLTGSWRLVGLGRATDYETKMPHYGYVITGEAGTHAWGFSLLVHCSSHNNCLLYTGTFRTLTPAEIIGLGLDKEIPDDLVFE